MLDFDVQRCTRRCAKTNREFQPGERFYSVLVTQDADVLRQDFAESVWDGPPERCLGWWKSTMPDANTNKMSWAPNDVMVHVFEQTLDLADKADMRYVLALLLIRRKIAKLEGTETDEQGMELLKIYCPRKEQHYDVEVTEPTPARAKEIQDELTQLLFANPT